MHGSPLRYLGGGPLTPTGPGSATAGSGTFGAAPHVPAPTGNYVFVASYSGDANYSASITACADAAERVTVNALPTISVTKTAAPLTRPEPGGTFTFNVAVTNTGSQPVTITQLTDNIYGNLNGQGTCAVGAALPPGGTYSCSFVGSFTGGAPASQTDVVTATAVDAGGNAASASDNATVTITPVLPSIVVAKTATPLSLPEPGGTFAFIVTVTNTSLRSVTITSLIDNIYGNVATKGTCVTAVGTVLAPDPDGAGPMPGGTYTCSFQGVFTGSGGATQTDTVTANAVDSLGQSAIATDDAVVTLTSTAPSQPRPLLGDFNGDGQTDTAVWRPSNGTWYVRGISETVWGQSGDIPVPADYAGDVASELAVWRPSNGTWYIRGVAETVWGQMGDIPVPAGYNGDGKVDLAVFRPSNGTWYVKGISETVWGQSGDIPVAADYFGDAKADLAVWRPSNGTWYVRGISETVWGQSGDVPVAGDYNGGGGVDIAVWRPINATWYVRGISETLWGISTDIPV